MGAAIRAVCCASMLGCASGDGDFDSTPGPMFGEGSGTTDGESATSKFDSNEGGGSSSGEEPLPPDVGACGDDGDCVLEDDSCFEPFGTCVDNGCTFAPKLAGVPCDDADPCTEADVCNGVGGCLGAPTGCNSECDAGWGDCNAQPDDGCETALDTVTDCGDCGIACDGGPNGSAACIEGVCGLACDDPWEDCDGDPSNGCEIPTGVANQCDVNGLNANNGCWTAYCGSSNHADATNFGTWFCFECSTCHVPSGGQCQWCNHSTGNWYSPDTCPCGDFEDDVCSP